MAEKSYIEIEEIIKRIRLRIADYNRDFNSFAPKMVLAYKELLNMVEHLPTADVQEVRHGEWIDNTEDVYFGNSFVRKHCSECGDEPEYREGKNSYVLSNYCRNCGAKMDKE